MSDFLVNLARRGAGLAPIVRSLAPRPAEPGVDPFGGGAADESAPDTKQAHEPDVVMAPDRAAAAPAAPPAAEPCVVPIAAPVTAVPVPLVQRTPMAIPSAPLAAPNVQAPPAAPPVRTAPVAPAPPRSELAPAAHRMPALSPAVASVERHDAPAPIPGTPVALETSRSDRVDEASTTRPEPVRTIERWNAHTHVVERLVEPPTAGDAPRPIAHVDLMPLAAPATVSAAYAEPAPERVVHVRIGAIEIHAAPPAAPLPAAPIPATPETAAAPPGNFDDFVRLRSYAPWAW